MIRGDVRGWSKGAVQRHTRWLYSVDGESLDALGVGYAVTLTVRDTPSTAAEWHSLRRAWLRALERSGAVAVHWVIEWQRRGTPHLHTAIYFDPEVLQGRDGGAIARSLWVARAARFGAELAAQYALPIRDALGWSKYLSKHASRGVRHYQRQGIPEGWEKSGRLWGHTGDWPSVEPDVVHLPRAVAARLPAPTVEESIGRPLPTAPRPSAVPAAQPQHVLRRQLRAYVLAQHREALRTAQTPLAASQARRGIRYARRMLKCSDRAFSTVRGVSLWIPYEVASLLVDWVARDAPEPDGRITP